MTSTKYKYIIGYGNNSTIVERVMKSRTNWVSLPYPSPSFNFRWSATSNGINFEKLTFKEANNNKQIVNHFEYHKALSCKSQLFMNL